MPLLATGKFYLGTEILRCPRCKGQNKVEIHSDLPEMDWLICIFCGYKAIINFIPILDKYGLPHGLSRPENRQIGRHVKQNLQKI